MTSAAIDLDLKPSRLASAYRWAVIGLCGPVFLARAYAELLGSDASIGSSLLTIFLCLVAIILLFLWSRAQTRKALLVTTLSFRAGRWRLSAEGQAPLTLQWQDVVVLPFLVLLRFKTPDNAGNAHNTIPVWRDQLDRDAWRRLRLIAMHASLEPR